MPERRALQARDRVSRRERFRAEFGAAHMRMTGLAALALRDGIQTFGVAFVTHVVHKRPGAVERGGAEIILVPCDNVASGVADAAADAFDVLVDFAALLRSRRHDRE